MKIGIEVQRLFRPHKHGIEISALELLNALKSIDTENEYIVFVKEDEDNLCFQESDNFRIEKVKGKMFVDWEQYHLPRAAKAHNLDLLHCTGNTGPLSCSTPIVQTLHDIIFLDGVDFGGTMYQNFGNLYRRFIVPSFSKKSEQMITVSNHEKERICRRLKIDEDKIEVIYNGVDSKFFTKHPSPLDIKSRYNLPDKYLLFMGNEAPRKNGAGVLKAFEKLVSEYQHDIYLVAPGLTSEFTKSTIKDEQVANRVVSTGYIDSNDLGGIYQLAEAFVFPSFSEGFGIPVIEAMAGNTPVVTSNQSALPEVSGGNALLVDPKSSTEIAAALNDLLTDQALSEKLIAHGLQWAKEFSWENSARKLLNVYTKVYNRTKKANNE